MELDLRKVNLALDTDLARQRVKRLADIAHSFYPEPIEDVFVSEYREQDGTQVVPSLWFFTDNYMAEFKDPLRNEQFDLAPIKKRIRWVEVSRQSFDDWQATSESRFGVELSTAEEVTCSLKATGDNCLELLRIVRERLLPNMVSPPAQI